MWLARIGQCILTGPGWVIRVDDYANRPGKSRSGLSQSGYPVHRLGGKSCPPSVECHALEEAVMTKMADMTTQAGAALWLSPGFLFLALHWESVEVSCLNKRFLVRDNKEHFDLIFIFFWLLRLRISQNQQSL